MNDIYITLTGNVAAEPRQYSFDEGTRVTSLKVLTSHRYFDKKTGQWTDGERVCFTVRCWRALGENVAASVKAGHPVVVSGRLRIREFGTEGDRRFMPEIEASAVGHDLRWGTGAFTKPERGASGLVSKEMRERLDEDTRDWAMGPRPQRSTARPSLRDESNPFHTLGADRHPANPLASNNTTLATPASEEDSAHTPASAADTTGTLTSDIGTTSMSRLDNTASTLGPDTSTADALGLDAGTGGTLEPHEGTATWRKPNEDALATRKSDESALSTPGSDNRPLGKPGSDNRTVGKPSSGDGAVGKPGSDHGAMGKPSSDDGTVAKPGPDERTARKLRREGGSTVRILGGEEDGQGHDMEANAADSRAGRPASRERAAA